MEVANLLSHKFKALIFDCDGTLVDTAPLHYRALSEAFRAQGLSLDRDWYFNHLGKSRSALFQEFETSGRGTIDITAAAALSEEIFASIAHEVREIPTIASIAREYYGTVPMAVASGGQASLVTRILEVCGLIGLFDHIVTIDDVGEGKPSPELFLESARRLGELPESCLVLEDTDEGVEAAQRANMAVIDVRRFVASLMSRDT